MTIYENLYFMHILAVKVKNSAKFGPKKIRKSDFFDFFSISPKKKLASIGCLGKGLRCGKKKFNFSKEKMDF